MRYAWILIPVALTAVAASVAACSGERDSVTSLHKYNGLTRESVIAALGEPQHVLSIRRSNAGTEFHGSLLSLPAAPGEDREFGPNAAPPGRPLPALSREREPKSWRLRRGLRHQDPIRLAD